MKRVTVAVTLAMLAACKSEPAHEKLKGHQFEFRNLVARHTKLDEAQALNMFSDCKAYGPRLTTCDFSQLQVAGLDVTRTTADFIDGTFNDLDATLSKQDYESLGRELSKIYGKPCKTEAAMEAESKRLGKIIRGREVQWCFENGWMNLMESARHGTDDEAELEFLSNRDTTGEQNYNASTL
jgi:hypothetical protein